MKPKYFIPEWALKSIIYLLIYAGFVIFALLSDNDMFWQSLPALAGAVILTSELIDMAFNKNRYIEITMTTDKDRHVVAEMLDLVVRKGRLYQSDIEKTNEFIRNNTDRKDTK